MGSREGNSITKIAPAALIPLFIASALLFSGCGAFLSPDAAEASPTPAPYAANGAASPSPASAEATASATPAASANTPDALPDFFAALDELTALYNEAKEINPDVFGYIAIPGTAISYPIVMAEDNEFYLTHGWDNEEAREGAIFADAGNRDASLRRHVVLYGHNMRAGTMFHDLMRFKQEDFFSDHRYVFAVIEGEGARYRTVAAYAIPPAKDYSVNYCETLIADGESLQNYMAEVLEYAKASTPSVVDGDFSPTVDDCMLTLTTCTYEVADSRFALLCVKAG